MHVTKDDGETRRRRGTPTTIIVTMVGAALTAWVIPAVTRQWDDRQKAHELRAALVTDMATATAGALFSSRDAPDRTASIATRRAVAIAGKRPAAAPAVIAKASQNWEIASFEIESKLRAYFPAPLVGQWRTYSTTVRDFLLLVGTPNLPQDLVLDQVASGLHLSVERLRHEARAFELPPSQIARAGQRVEYNELENAVLNAEERLSESVLTAHPSGFSTTTGDLLRDLFP